MESYDDNSAGHSCPVNLYGADGVKAYHEKVRQDPLVQAFLYPAMIDFLKTEVPGKSVIDIGCGTGYWSYQAAQHRAKLVHGFDIQDNMVALARQATSEFSNVHIQVGDIMNMPYDDNSFEVAMSVYVTGSLPTEVLKRHFTELYRVLVPGGKAMVLNLAKPAFDTFLVTCGTDRANTEIKINKILTNLPKYPTYQQINKALEPLHEIIHACFATDAEGNLFLVNSTDQLNNGQAVWNKSQIIIFPNYYYDDQFLKTCTVESGLKIGNVETFFTEERRVAYNNTFSATFDKTVTAFPRALMYHLQKPITPVAYS